MGLNSISSGFIHQQPKNETLEMNNNIRFVKRIFILTHLCWKICATKARLRFGDPSTMSLAVKYLLQPILSACSRTNFALSKGFLTANVEELMYSGARTFRRCA